MSSGMYAVIRIPASLKNKVFEDEVLETIRSIAKEYGAEESEDNGVIEYSSTDLRDGEFSELEDYLIKLSIPFDRYTEESPESSGYIRYYRPDINYDEEIDVDYDKHPVLRTQEVFEYVQRYANGFTTQADLVTEIANLITERDPLLTKVIQHLEDLV